MTLLVYDPIYLEHNTGAHPENFLRLANTVKYFAECGIWDQCEIIENPRAATLEEIEYCHSRNLYERVKMQSSRSSGGYMDADTIVSPKSLQAALKAAGGTIEACDKVMNGDVKNALCLLRPPGHHATPTTSMGFCLFNNIAIGARHLQKKHGVKKIAILDFDIHHGNGTQDIFYEDPDVFYASVHLSPFFPGTGSARETGAGAGEGATYNIPLSHHHGEDDYVEAVEKLLEEGIKPFKPEFLMISAGFDPYENDPLSGLGVSIEGFYRITKPIIEAAEELCGGKVVSCLEGGYNLDMIPMCIEAHLKALMEA